MDLEYFQNYANEVCSKYEILPVTVKFVWENPEFPNNKKNKNYLGMALPYRRMILVRDGRDFDHMMETLNHELAHFIAFAHGDSAHGPMFKKYARILGAFPRAHVGTIAAEKAKDKKISSDKARRAKNRKEHPTHSDPYQHLTCHICMRELMGN